MRTRMRTDRSYQETIEYLFALQKHGVKLGLGNTERLMDIMGNPHRRFRSVHVAGTNGKGSTAAFLTGMLLAAGYRVGLYTSPHLVSFTERIRINGVPITEGKVVELARRVREGYEGRAGDSGLPPALNPTFFEVTTALAFTYFAEEAVDIAVIEVGMGGRLDATNVISPLVSVITNIDLEHTEFLGDTLELIAGEKAGIIKRNTPVVTGAVQPGVLQVIEREAARKAAPVFLLGREFRANHIRPGGEQQFTYRGMRMSLEGLGIVLLGRYQVDNACLALAAAECLHAAGVTITEDAVRKGLAQSRWEGRLERVARRPDIYLDGAHNPASARLLARAVAELRPAYGRLMLVVGILGDKDVSGILAELIPLADRVIVTRPDYARALDPDALAAKVRSLHPAVDTAGSVRQAIERAKSEAKADDLILITGSLYVVGDARAVLFDDGLPRALPGLKG